MNATATAKPAGARHGTDVDPTALVGLVDGAGAGREAHRHRRQEERGGGGGDERGDDERERREVITSQAGPAPGSARRCRAPRVRARP